jgi:hypothetical protein
VPSVSPLTIVEWAVPPVVANTFGIELNATPEIVEYRHVAFSSVVRLNVVCVVPAASVPLGAPFVLTGGVVSGAGIATEKLIEMSSVLALPTGSWHLTKNV